MKLFNIVTQYIFYKQSIGLTFVTDAVFLRPSVGCGSSLTFSVTALVAINLDYTT
jgi:hypothetical protein